MSRRAEAPAGARKRTSALRRPRVDRVPRNVIAEISAEPVPTASGGNSRAVRTQNAIPTIDVSPVPAMSAYALRRIGSRRWVTTLAVIPVVMSGGSGDPDPVDLERRREPRGLVRWPGVDSVYGRGEYETCYVYR